MWLQVCYSNILDSQYINVLFTCFFYILFSISIDVLGSALWFFIFSYKYLFLQFVYLSLIYTIPIFRV